MPATMDAWGGAELTVAINDVDYSCYVTECNVTRARNRVWDPSEAGTCNLRLELVDNAVAASTGDVGESVKVTLAYGSVSRRIFTGRVQYRHAEISPGGDILTLDCVDEFMYLARVNFRGTYPDGTPVGSPVGGGEDVPTRIARWITESGTSAPIALDPSTYTCPATLIDGNTLLQIQATAFADGGDFFVQGDGTLTFKAWAWQVTADSAECIFSDRNLSGWVPYTSAVYANDLDEVQNHVTATRRPDPSVSMDLPVPQIAQNVPSVGIYGPIGDTLDNLELADDTQVVNRASAWVEIAAFPNPRFDSIVVQPAIDPPLAWPQVIPLTYSALIACNRKFADGTDVSRYGHIIGERWTLNPNLAEVEYRCSGTGTWDATRPPRPPTCITTCPDGSITICDGYPCNDTCPVILKDNLGNVLAAYPPGSLCHCGVVFPPDGLYEICLDCGSGLETCVLYTPESVNALLWLDAVDEVPNREREKIEGTDPYTPGFTTGFAGTRLNVIDGTHDSIDATLAGGLIAAGHSHKLETAHFDGGWTIDFYLWLQTDLLTATSIDIIDMDSVKIRIEGYLPGGLPATRLKVVTVSTVSGVDVTNVTGGLADIPLAAWHHWRFLWDDVAAVLTLYRDGVIV